MFCTAVKKVVLQSLIASASGTGEGKIKKYRKTNERKSARAEWERLEFNEEEEEEEKLLLFIRKEWERN